MGGGAVSDPTRDELIQAVEDHYPEVFCETPHPESDCPDGCGCRFVIEAVAYWLAAHYHAGQGSDLYSALCQSPYCPGYSERDLPNRFAQLESDLYRVVAGSYGWEVIG